MKRFFRFFQVGVLGLLVSLWLSNVAIAPATAHWADLAVADITIAETDVQITLTVPTALLAFADDNGNKQLSPSEVTKHYMQLEQQLSRHIALTNQTGESGSITITSTTAPQPKDRESHSTFLLQYQWPTPLQTLSMRYSLFSPEFNQVVTTITQGNQTRNVVFTPENNSIEITDNQSVHPIRYGISALMTLLGSIWFAERALATIL